MDSKRFFKIVQVASPKDKDECHCLCVLGNMGRGQGLVVGDGQGKPPNMSSCGWGDEDEEMVGKVW